MNESIHEDKNGMSHYIVQNLTADISTQQFMLQKKKRMAFKV